ncbi:MAG TPA: tetratricopeptide repeat protein, partial [Thermoanaerobaculia bacterium]|nr:tetratricopeptide repeat protein [Thermoanaerobaculia bacterium]
QPEKARVAFKALVDADPKDAHALFYLAESMGDLEQFEEADKIYRRLLEQTPDDPEILASYGLSQASQGKLDDAASTFKVLLGLRDLPENLSVLAKTQIARIHLQKGEYEAAVDSAKAVLVFHDMPNIQAVSIAVTASKKEKNDKQALQLLQPLVDKYANDPFVNASYIEVLTRLGEKEKARVAAATQAKFGTRNTVAAAEAMIQAENYTDSVALLKEALAAKPDDVDLQFELGSAMDRSGRKQESEKVFLGIIQKHPDHAGTLNYLGYMWAENGENLDRAAELVSKAISQEPRNGAYIDSLGWIYFRQGKLDLAEKFLTDATRLLPRDATVLEHLGDVLAKRGDIPKALNLYRTALKFEPEAKDEEKLRSKIADLEKRPR